MLFCLPGIIFPKILTFMLLLQSLSFKDASFGHLGKYQPKSSKICYYLKYYLHFCLLHVPLFFFRAFTLYIPHVLFLFICSFRMEGNSMKAASLLHLLFLEWCPEYWSFPLNIYWKNEYTDHYLNILEWYLYMDCIVVLYKN